MSKKKLFISKRHLRYSVLLGIILTILLMTLRSPDNDTEVTSRALKLTQQQSQRESRPGSGSGKSFFSFDEIPSLNKNEGGFMGTGNTNELDSTLNFDLNDDDLSFDKIPKYDEFGELIDYSKYIPKLANYTNATLSQFTAKELIRFKQDYDNEQENLKMKTREEKRAKFIKSQTERYGGPDTLMSAMVPSWANVGDRPKACLFAYIEDDDHDGIMKSINEMEDMFNRQFNYPWVFLTRYGISEEFKQDINDTLRVDFQIGQIDEKDWNGYPSFIDDIKAEEAKIKMAGLEFGDSLEFRLKNRYFAGLFWKHALFKDFDWYWRVEPNMELRCEIDYDVFRWLQDKQKSFGFSISKKENKDTLPGLWDEVKKFKDENKKLIHDKNFMRFVSDDDGNSFNQCSFWSNFEVANLNFFRSSAFNKFFESLDNNGGFFYERWATDPLHTIAVSLLVSRDTFVIFFLDFGFYSEPYENCPLDDIKWRESKCKCDQGNDFTFMGGSCTKKFYEVMEWPKPDGWNKRT
ncbi:putative mannosyltransferase NDAI_0E02990 [Naumovozyma dairenensis CBS 421]|uniref:Glycosyltransferase family 15 protein n=1 Tax=Naumovozyma dairenensis (strain ATCC 10597 / BCRC 20456 / CBS 421 / NBRC 0211 / NRRL Y-12639) TaxID=1071378 RepID=G0WBJ6_NAUDC|nr:hypothetical protein NDAI_0E02990 [Naumovozyma dairenensis CBS 421]CCD25116.1 hypothetical protein NDAI_0E02990 [Naumovozyma dairenensis CBS 421]